MARLVWICSISVVNKVNRYLNFRWNLCSLQIEFLKIPRHGEKTNRKDYSFHRAFFSEEVNWTFLNSGKITHLLRTVKKMLIGKVGNWLQGLQGYNYNPLWKNRVTADNLTDRLLISQEIEEAWVARDPVTIDFTGDLALLSTQPTWPILSGITEGKGTNYILLGKVQKNLSKQRQGVRKCL